MQHFTVTFQPDDKQVVVPKGTTLLEAAGKAGIVLNSVCGGAGTCHKCKVLLAPAQQPVLACQYKVQSDLDVTIPVQSRGAKDRILEHGLSTAVPVEPDVYKKYLPNSPAARVFGLAVDIGTTTVVAKLVDMTTGRCIATAAMLNPQIRFGDDVISRISYARTDQSRRQLQQLILDCLNQLIERLCRQTSVRPEEIYELCAVGNTTMNHILLGLPVEQLGQAPYQAYSLDPHDVRPAELALRINNAGNVHTLANIAGFVGSDTTAVALAVDIDSADDGTLVIDVGTNGELLLAARGKLFAASCAAGPAFEGARIYCGSRAAEGAIESVTVADGDLHLGVIGEVPPRSICGSGLIDAIAVLLDLGLIDNTGRFVEPDRLPATLPSSLRSRLREVDGQAAVVLSAGEEPDHPAVYLTQADVRQAQLAKAAVRAGVMVLQQQVGFTDQDLRRVLLAGGFGNYVRVESALRIGLLPSVEPDCVEFVGNAACSGAHLALVSSRLRQQAARLARKIEYVEVAHQRQFAELFAHCIYFDPQTQAHHGQ